MTPPGAAEFTCSIEEMCINTIRTLSMDAIQAANSGHPGAPMGLAPAAYVLWTRLLRHNPKDPCWLNRDRFVLSGGHASMLLYSVLHLTGYDLSLEDLKQFRQWGSRTPGHPEYGHTPGVETTTGPLGQGFTNAVGMAIAERSLAARFNREGHEVVNHDTYVMCGDGDLMEGISYEAASLAGHLGLGKLIAIYDDNRISIEGATDITFTEDVEARFAAMGWHTQRIGDGNDTVAIENALKAAKAEADHPSIILLRTTIAYGSPNKSGKSSAHGEPLGKEEICLTKTALGCPANSEFCVPDTIIPIFRECIEKGRAEQAEWEAKLSAYKAAHPDLGAEWDREMAWKLPENWDADVPAFTPDQGPIATRAASGQVLNALAGRIPALMGGSADLAPSNKTFINGAPEFQKGEYGGRNFRFGVREHAMGAIMNGMALHGGVRPYGGTFLVFADYMRPAIRLAALMKLPVLYVFTHDSIAVGEDGPTHQPIEHLLALRAIPGLTVIRPGDATETAECWKAAMECNQCPTALILSRQKLPILDRTACALACEATKGAYILQDTGKKPDVILISSGAEIHVAVKAGELLAQKGVSARIVSMPSWELFEAAGEAYKNTVLPPEITARVAVEAGLTLGWERYTGANGAVVGIDHFGASAPGGVLMEKFGITAENVAEKALAVIEKAKG